MYTITALEQQQHNQDRVNVYLDGEFAFGLNIMDAAHLKKGQQLSESDVTLLKQDDAVVRAVETAVNFLSFRPRSIHEVRQNLQKKQVPNPVIDATLERLAHLGYVDDVAFARYWVENRNTFKPRSRMALSYELRQKGVDDDLIQQVLDEKVDDEASAYQAAGTRLRRLRGLDRMTFQQKLGAFLQRRGYHYGTIQTVLPTLMAELEQDDPAYFQDEAG